MPIRTLSALYQTASIEVSETILIGIDGRTEIRDRVALQQALQSIVPPNDSRIEQLIEVLSAGWIMRGGTPIAPWSLFTDPAAVSSLDAGAWNYFGFKGENPKPFDQFENVPEAVLTAENLSMLKEEAAYPLPLTPGTMLQRIRGAAGIGGNLRQWQRLPRLPGADVATTSQALDSGGSAPSGPSPQQLTELQKLINCFTNASWSLTWYGVVVCFGTECAQTLRGLLNTAGAALIPGLVAGIGAYVAGAGVATAVAVALAAWGGWVAAAIFVSAFYWGLMVALNMTTRGVCCHIPGPWTLGLLGPGWAVGR